MKRWRTLVRKLHYQSYWPATKGTIHRIAYWTWTDRNTDWCEWNRRISISRRSDNRKKMRSEQEKQRGSRVGSRERRSEGEMFLSFFSFALHFAPGDTIPVPFHKKGVVRKSISSMTPLLRRIKATLKCRRIAVDAIFDFITYHSIDRLGRKRESENAWRLNKKTKKR